MQDDESNRYARGPQPGSSVPVAPPPWQPPASKERARYWLSVCRSEIDDAIAARDAISETEEPDDE